jgi:hypothetical protein
LEHQIVFVADEETRNTGRTTCVENLLVEDAHLLEGRPADHREHQHVAVNAQRVMGVKGGVFVLTRGVHDLNGVLFTLVPQHLGEGVLDGWMIVIHELIFHKLQGDGRFA